MKPTVTAMDWRIKKPKQLDLKAFLAASVVSLMASIPAPAAEPGPAPGFDSFPKQVQMISRTVDEAVVQLSACEPFDGKNLPALVGCVRDGSGFRCSLGNGLLAPVVFIYESRSDCIKARQQLEEEAESQ